MKIVFYIRPSKMKLVRQSMRWKMVWISNFESIWYELYFRWSKYNIIGRGWVVLDTVWFNHLKWTRKNGWEFLPRQNWGTKAEINSWKIFFYIDFGRWYIIRHLEVNLTPSGRSWTCLNVVKHVLIFQSRSHRSFFESIKGYQVDPNRRVLLWMVENTYR